MYKLFLTLRYLTRKAIVIFPILVVWLCVAMMIIVASIMGGFVDHVKQANRDLLGDIIISTRSGYGFPYYEDLQAQLATLKDKDGHPLVEVSTPLIKSYGLINFPDYHVNNFAQVVGVDPVGRTATTGFRQTLYRQFTLPTQAADILAKTGLPATGKDLVSRAEQAYDGVGTQVTGTLQFNGTGPNLFDPANGTVPAEAENAAGPTIPISSTLQEFAYAKLAEGRSITADFTGSNLAVTTTAGPAGSPPWKMTLTDPAFTAIRKTSDDFPTGGLLVSFDGHTITLTCKGATAPGNFTATFDIGSSCATSRSDDAQDALDKAKTAGITGNALEKLKDTADTAQVNLYLAQRVWKLAGDLDAAHSYTSAAEIRDRLTPANPSFAIAPALLAMNTRDPKDPPVGCIPAIGIGMYKRDRHGDFVRPTSLDNLFCELTVVPLSSRGMTIEPQHGSFVVVDDSYSQVIDVDSTYVYAPFEKVQKLALMDEGDDGFGNKIPARCTEIQLKTKGGDDPRTLLANRAIVEQAVTDFINQPRHSRMIPLGVEVETWDQKQALYIAAVENEKSMITFILALMSVVVLVVIFLIFYMIVRDKTRDIGIVKALGGSEAGVMAIFMLYGTFIGTVGGLLGMVSGVVFVWNTNFIHDKIIYGIFGVMIWRRDIYLFDKIPDTVHPWEVAAYVAAAIVAGFLGATIPAVIASRQDPVKAVRYE